MVRTYKHTSTIEVKVNSIVRLRNTGNGGPRFRLNTDAGSFTTAGDHQFTYQLSEGTYVDGRRAIIEVTRSGLATDLEWADR